MPKFLKIGIVGCGAIGSSLAKAIVSRFGNLARLSGLYDIDANKSRHLAKLLKKNTLVVNNLNSLIDRAELVVESAGAHSSSNIARESLKRRRSVLIMSVGGVIKDFSKLSQIAKENGANILIPSGAICGIDGLKALTFSKIKSVVITTKKPPQAFSGVAYIKLKNIQLDKIKKDTVIFQGNALYATKFFPQNINVAATLSLAGIGPKQTLVKIVASPGLKRNIHEVEVVSDAARISTRTENIAHPDNPKTSYLAVLSAISALEQFLKSSRIGN
jgi:aspartate dehydrogenase